MSIGRICQHRVPLLLVAVTVLTISGASAQVVFDSSASASTSSVPTLSLSWSHTTSGDPDRAIVVGVSFVDFGLTQNSPRPRTAATTTVTYGGTPLTFLTSTVDGSMIVDLFGLSGAPVATGPNTVEVTVVTLSLIVAGSVSATGVDTTSPFNPLGGFTFTGPIFGMTLPGTTSTSLVVDAIANTDPFTDVGPDLGQTERWDEGSTTEAVRGAGSTEPGGDGSTSTGWSSVPSAMSPGLRGTALPSTRWIGAMVEILAATAAGPIIAGDPPSGTFTDGESMDFTITNEGAGDARVVELRGPGALTITAVTIVGPDAGDFQLIAPPPPPLPILLNDGESFIATVQFNPSSAGPKTAFLQVNSNAVNVTFLQIPLNAIAVLAGPIPTLSTWGLVLMAGVLALVGWSRLRRRQRAVR